jgi:glutamate/tyrosine decarboxylase-like PLP-dependent enzyme
MRSADWKSLLEVTEKLAVRHIEGLDARPVAATASRAELRARLDGPLPLAPQDPEDVVRALSSALEDGVVGSPSGRYFGFVIGGSVPAAMAADWLVSAWDQNAGGDAVAPGVMVVEEIAARWLTELFGLPAGTSVGFVTGGQMANTTCLAAARHGVLKRVGWDVDVDGLVGGPPVTVLATVDRHGTIDRALRLLGFGTARTVLIDTDDQARMRPDALRKALKTVTGPTIVCSQVGEIHTGALDPVGEIADLAHERDAWVHVDGAFGLWALLDDRLAEQTRGVERADSWSTDAHKWLNVPYDCGISFVADAAAHRGAFGATGAYLVYAQDARDAFNFNPELSRRARSVPVYAALRALGRDGVVDLVQRCCRYARRFAEVLSAADGIEVVNSVVLNQVSVRFGDDDGLTDAVVSAVQQDGTCWVGGSLFRGRRVMRISVVGWATDDSDVERSCDAILRAWDQVRVRADRGEALSL